MLNGQRVRYMAVSIGAAALCSGSPAAETGFESLSEDFYGETFTVDGLTFQNAQALGPATFAIDNGVDLWPQMGAMADYLQGNVLTLAAITPGPGGAAFAGTESLEITTGSIASHATIDVGYMTYAPPSGPFAELDFSKNVLMMEALLDGEVVASTSVFTDIELVEPEWANGNIYGAVQLEISGTAFDTVRIVSDGPENGGMGLMAFDNVAIVPGPGGAAVLLLGIVAGRRRRR